MLTPVRGVLARVAMTVISLGLAASLILAAQPAGAAGRQADPLAVAASDALAALAARQESRAALVRGDLEYGAPEVVGADTAYERARWRVAAHAAPRAGVDPVGLDQAWDRAGDQRMVAVLAALSQVGVPYRRNTSSPGVGFDCSGLTAFAWGAAGVSLPRNSSAQISSVPNKPVEAVAPGDLVQYPGHVMLALGYGTAIVHASHPGKPVEVKAWSRARRAGSPIG